MGEGPGPDCWRREPGSQSGAQRGAVGWKTEGSPCGVRGAGPCWTGCGSPLVELVARRRGCSGASAGDASAGLHGPDAVGARRAVAAQQLDALPLPAAVRAPPRHGARAALLARQTEGPEGSAGKRVAGSKARRAMHCLALLCLQSASARSAWGVGNRASSARPCIAGWPTLPSAGAPRAPRAAGCELRVAASRCESLRVQRASQCLRREGTGTRTRGASHRL